MKSRRKKPHLRFLSMGKTKSGAYFTLFSLAKKLLPGSRPTFSPRQGRGKPSLDRLRKP